MSIKNTTWQRLLEKYSPLFGTYWRAKNLSESKEDFLFFGLVDGIDDYYYGLVGMKRHKLRLVTCVGPLEMLYEHQNQCVTGTYENGKMIRCTNKNGFGHPPVYCEEHTRVLFPSMFKKD